MLNPGIRKIVILGAGRVAVNLSVAIRKEGYEIIEVCNRTESRGQHLAGKLKAKYVREPEMVNRPMQIFIS